MTETVDSGTRWARGMGEQQAGGGRRRQARNARWYTARGEHGLCENDLEERGKGARGGDESEVARGGG